MYELFEVGKNEFFLNVIVLMLGIKDEGVIMIFIELKFNEFENSLVNLEVIIFVLLILELLFVLLFDFLYNNLFK